MARGQLLSPTGSLKSDVDLQIYEHLKNLKNFNAMLNMYRSNFNGKQIYSIHVAQNIRLFCLYWTDF